MLGFPGINSVGAEATGGPAVVPDVYDFNHVATFEGEFVAGWGW